MTGTASHAARGRCPAHLVVADVVCGGRIPAARHHGGVGHALGAQRFAVVLERGRHHRLWHPRLRHAHGVAQCVGSHVRALPAERTEEVGQSRLTRASRGLKPITPRGSPHLIRRCSDALLTQRWRAMMGASAPSRPWAWSCCRRGSMARPNRPDRRSQSQCTRPLPCATDSRTLQASRICKGATACA